ncbi:MAG: phosphoribosylglycinamide formyltransferase [Parvularculaceae bacterium]|nr:phosphoribosylglycinamide formyltransferase [Parvularculaceae bacterium]
MTKLRVAILISGRGSNMKALIDAARDERHPAEIVLVVSNRPDAGGLSIAEASGVKTLTIDHKSFGRGPDGKRLFEAALSEALKAARADLVCLAGFMRLLSAEFVGDWRGRLINIHPSLLPAFKGLDVHEETLRAGVKLAGCTVHFVSPEMDAGPIIGQAAVCVHAADTPDTLAARILEQEHRLYPECVRRIAEGEISLGGDGLVRISQAGGGALSNPAPR